MASHAALTNISLTNLKPQARRQQRRQEVGGTGGGGGVPCDTPPMATRGMTSLSGGGLAAAKEQIATANNRQLGEKVDGSDVIRLVGGEG